MSILGTRLVISVSGSTTNHVYSGESIQGAINSAQPGDTIFVHSGTYYEHVVANKTVALIGEDMHDTIVDGNFTGAVIHITVNNVTISHFTIRNSGEEPWVRGGIFLDGSSGNNISNNIITNNRVGIRSKDSNNNTISGNNVSSNKYSGIGMERSSSNNTLIGNTVFSNNYKGIVLGRGSNYNTLIGNNVSSNREEGIFLAIQCSHNTVTENTISENLGGIDLCDSNDNMIFHNNFINNKKRVVDYDSSTNIWDDGYPSGGNYWSDYAGVDLHSGPYQNENGSDGIGDKPHIIDENNQDNYPLMSPWSPTRVEEEVPLWMRWWLFAIVAAGIVALDGAVYFLKKRKSKSPLRFSVEKYHL